jgi:ribonuclease D
MTKNQMSPAQWIDSDAALAKVCPVLSASPMLGVDTESNSLYVYKEQVCLIQISTLDQDYLIDPLSIKDISPLAPIFASPDTEKIFHAAEYDVICLKRDFNFEINAIFDTMLAARILGKKNNGLGAILEEEYGIVVDKRFQRANWGKRPISQEMLYYAQMDSHFLIELRQKFHKQLQETERIGLADEDFSRLSKIEPPRAPSYETDAWKLANGQSYQNKQLSVLMALCQYRDQLAQERNVPLFKIFPNQFIQALVENMPSNRDEIFSMGYSSMKQVSPYIQPILKIIAEARLNKANFHAQYTQKPDWEFFKRMDALRSWRKQKAVQMKVMSDIILPKDILMDITQENPHSMTKLAEIMKDNPWRYQAFGEEILTVIHE